MNYLRTSLISLTLMFSTVSFAPVSVLCRGFLPPNNMKIPVRTMSNGGITQAEFNDVLDQLEKYYKPVVQAKGGSFQVTRLWTDDTVNASADRQGNVWNLNMYGGLARYNIMTKDTFMLVACHETGHHLGGAPKIADGGIGVSDWASNEGQADYYSTLDCMRFMFNDADNADFVQHNQIDPVLAQSCGTAYTMQNEKNLCMRSGMAGLIISDIFKDLNKDSTSPSFATPDPKRVDQTDDDHPATQCRLDTYFQGGLCAHDMAQMPSDTDPTVGACTAAGGQHIGLRPTCWYAP